MSLFLAARLLVRAAGGASVQLVLILAEDRMEPLGACCQNNHVSKQLKSFVALPSIRC